MKKTVCSIVFLFLSVLVFAQNQNRFIYCEMTSSKMPSPSTEVSVKVDFGQDAVYTGFQLLRDEAGNVMTFNSHIDALNFMADKGWECVQLYLTGERQNNITMHWIMRLDTTNLNHKQIEYVLSVLKTKRNFVPKK